MDMNLSDLPVEVHYIIFEYLDYSDLLLSVSTLNVKMNAIVNSYYKFSNVKELSNYKYCYNSVYQYVKWESDRELSLLFNSLRYNNTIQDLYIYLSESVSDEALRNLSDTLQYNSSVDKLSLYFDHATQILSTLTGILNNVSIKSLTMYFSERYYYYSRKVLRPNHTEIFLKSVCEIIEINKTIVSLDISCIEIGNKRLDKIMRSFQSNQSIKILNIRATSCDMDKNFLDSLTRTNLELVDINYNKISDIDYFTEWMKNSNVKLKMYRPI